MYWLNSRPAKSQYFHRQKLLWEDEIKSMNPEQLKQYYCSIDPTYVYCYEYKYEEQSFTRKVGNKYVGMLYPTYYYGVKWVKSRRGLHCNGTKDDWEQISSGEQILDAENKLLGFIPVSNRGLSIGYNTNGGVFIGDGSGSQFAEFGQGAKQSFSDVVGILDKALASYNADQNAGTNMTPNSNSHSMNVAASLESPIGDGGGAPSLNQIASALVSGELSTDTVDYALAKLARDEVNKKGGSYEAPVWGSYSEESDVIASAYDKGRQISLKVGDVISYDELPDSFKSHNTSAGSHSNYVITGVRVGDRQSVNPNSPYYTYRKVVIEYEDFQSE